MAAADAPNAVQRRIFQRSGLRSVTTSGSRSRRLTAANATTCRQAAQVARCCSTWSRSSVRSRFSEKAESKFASGCSVALTAVAVCSRSRMMRGILGASDIFKCPVYLGTLQAAVLAKCSSWLSRLLFLLRTQPLSHVQSQIADIHLQRLLGSARTHATLRQGFQYALSQVADNALHAAADSGFMHGQRGADLRQGVAVEEICGQDKTVFRRQRAQRLVGGGRQPGVGAWLRRRFRRKLAPGLGLFLQAHQPPLLAVAIHPALCQHG